eukprot:Gregarina_sp_Poly_1__7772@NODE_43_length_18077_cov_117_559078_g37_i0_p18_GENE_NODE_43_length_18077_cov_117_559078_g37_i0NODE_43_length_18077_cov_117_559078_g37_i0_p18_ORF_typecomplete_len124_score7_39Atg29_N/PF18388_1/0_0047_NODE_43_length_18077_cov_117_559078_g37_i063906761
MRSASILWGSEYHPDLERLSCEQSRWATRDWDPTPPRCRPLTESQKVDAPSVEWLAEKKNGLPLVILRPSREGGPLWSSLGAHAHVRQFQRLVIAPTAPLVSSHLRLVCHSSSSHLTLQLAFS